MDLSSVRIAVGACAVFGGLALVSGGAVANAAPGAHSAASDSATAADDSAGSTGQVRSGVGRAASSGNASNGGASSVITNPKGKPTLDLSSVFGGQQSSPLPNPAAAIPNSAAATGPNSPSTTPSSSGTPTSPSSASGTTQPAAAPATDFGSVAAHTNTSGPLGSVERVVDRTWSVFDAFGNAIGVIVNGVGAFPSTVVKTPSDRAPSNGGAAVNGFLSEQSGFGNPGASALAAGRVTLTPGLGYSQLPAAGGNSFAGPNPSAILTPDLVSAAESANAGSPPVITPVPVPGAKWLTDLPLQVRNALRTATTAELLMGALPGLLGLVAFFVAGVGLGRRQAKFGFAMESTDIMRFAAKGPLGVVRGSFIAVSPKRTPVVRSKSTAKLTLVDRVA